MWRLSPWKAATKPLGSCRPRSDSPGQVEARRPALGPFGQALHVVGRQPQSHRPVQQGRGLLAGELQVGDPELGHVPTDPHPGHGQRRVGTAGQRHMDARREVVQEIADALVAGGVGDQVVVVQDQEQR
jgi:hypothetical protein